MSGPATVTIKDVTNSFVKMMHFFSQLCHYHAQAKVSFTVKMSRMNYHAQDQRLTATHSLVLDYKLHSVSLSLG